LALVPGFQGQDRDVKYGPLDPHFLPFFAAWPKVVKRDWLLACRGVEDVEMWLEYNGAVETQSANGGTVPGHDDPLFPRITLVLVLVTGVCLPALGCTYNLGAYSVLNITIKFHLDLLTKDPRYRGDHTRSRIYLTPALPIYPKPRCFPYSTAIHLERRLLTGAIWKISGWILESVLAKALAIVLFLRFSHSLSSLSSGLSRRRYLYPQSSTVAKSCKIT
jgi:hypothetical protein